MEPKRNLTGAAIDRAILGLGAASTTWLRGANYPFLKAGIPLLRLTWARVTREPEAVVAARRALLER